MSLNKINCIIIIPAFNEEKSLPQLLPKIKNIMSDIDEKYKLLVCNDGSSDKTAEVRSRYLIIVLFELMLAMLFFLYWMPYFQALNI